MISIRWLLPFLLIPPVIAAFLAFFVPAPVHYFDEGGNLANALAVLGTGSDAANPYYFGYPLVISPAFLLFDDARLVFRMVQLINLAIFGVSCLMIALCVRKLLPLSSRSPSMLIYTLALAACLYPPFMFFNSMAWSESLIYLFVSLSCFILLDYVSTGRTVSIVALAVILGMATWIHPRLLPFIPAFMLAFPLILSAGKTKRQLLLFVVIASLVIVAYQAFVHPFFDSARMLNIDHFTDAEYAGTSALAALMNFTLSDYSSLIARFCGQLALFNIHGFFLPGMLIAKLTALYLNRASVPPSEMDRIFTPLVGFLTLAVLGIAAFVAIFFQVSFADELREFAVDVGEASFNNRVDHWVYGRYTDILLPGFLVFAAFYPDRKTLLLSLMATLVLAGFTIFFAPASMWAPNYVNILGSWSFHLPWLSQLEGFVEKSYLIRFLAIAIMGNFLIAFVFLRGKWFAACIAAVFLWTAAQDLQTTRLFEKYTVVRYAFGAAMRASLGEDSCIFADTDSFEVSHGMYAFVLTPHPLVALSPATRSRKCQGLITLRPQDFVEEFEQVTVPTDKFVGMVRRRGTGP